MDPIHPIRIDAPVPLPIAASPRVAPTGRDKRSQDDTASRRRRAARPGPRQGPDADPTADDGHLHIDVTA